MLNLFCLFSFLMSIDHTILGCNLVRQNLIPLCRHESTSSKGPFFPPARPMGPTPKKQEEMANKLRAKTPIGIE
jgi:hypothetical protein